MNAGELATYLREQAVLRADSYLEIAASSIEHAERLLSDNRAEIERLKASQIRAVTGAEEMYGVALVPKGRLDAAEAEIERLKASNADLHAQAREGYDWQEERDVANRELAAIIALGSLPPGAPAPEHPGEAYAVAVKLRAERDKARKRIEDIRDLSTADAVLAAGVVGAAALPRAVPKIQDAFRAGLQRLEELDAARARVAELETELAADIDDGCTCDMCARRRALLSRGK